MSIRFSNDIKISFVTGLCILTLAIITKMIFHLQLDFISQYGPVWIYITYIISKDKTKKSTTVFWSLAIILATMAILILYTI